MSSSSSVSDGVLVVSENLVKEHALMKSLLRNNSARRGKGFKNLKPFRTTMWSNSNTNTSGAASALVVNQAFSLNTSTFPAFTSFIALYDMIRVLKVKLHYYFVTSVAGLAGNTATQCACCISFDPTIGNPSSVQQLLEYSNSSGPHILGASTQIIPTNPKFHVLPVKMPGPIAPISSSDTPGSAWFVMDGGTAPIIAQVQAYIPSLGTAGVTQFVYFVELDVEMKMRQ